MSSGHTRRRSSAEEASWGGQLISISDLMASLLFIFILIVLLFAYQLNRAADQKKEATRDLTNSLAVRKQLLQDIHKSLQEHGFDIQVDYEHGLLSFNERILFPSGSATLRPEGLEALARLAEILAEVLPCYAGSADTPPPPGRKCGSGTRGKLEAIFIEGHTDTVRVGLGSAFRDNWDLSAQRAVSVYKQMVVVRSSLDSLLNASNQPLFSVSGYADRRPVGGLRASNQSEAGRSANRRIDVRFIMTYPKMPDPVKETGRRFEEVEPR